MSPGRLLLAAGFVLVLAGLWVEFGPAALRLGRLPGDISIGNANVRFFLPLGTSILFSILLTIIVSLMNRR